MEVLARTHMERPPAGTFGLSFAYLRRRAAATDGLAFRSLSGDGDRAGTERTLSLACWKARRRKPLFLLRLSGLFLFRFAERQFRGLFQ